MIEGNRILSRFVSILRKNELRLNLCEGFRSYCRLTIKHLKNQPITMNKLWILLLGFVTFSSFGQNEYDTIVIRDIESWTSASFEYKLNKDLTFNISPQLRLDKNSSQLERYLIDFEMNYDLSKNIEFGLGYRFYGENKKSGIQTGHRYNIDGKYKFEISRFNGYARLRYQSGREFGNGNNAWNNHFRLKTKFEYNFKGWKLDPEVSAEFFRSSGRNIDAQFDKMRFTIGSSYKFNKHHSISFFYGGEKQLNTSYPKTTYLFGIGYKYTLKHKKNED